MATRVKSTRWGYATRLTDVATDTTLAAATRYEFGEKTIDTPESGRTLRSAFLKISFVGANTSAIDLDGVRIGTNVEAAGWTDVDTTYTTIDSGETECTVLLHDATADVAASWGSGATFGIDVAVAAAHESASAIRGITCELFLTYDYDDSSATQQKSIIIPLQCGTTTLGTSYAEVGSTGTGAAGANLIPRLDDGAGTGYLVENGATIDDQYIIIHGLTSAVAATTDCTMSVRLDGATDLARFVCEEALQTSFQYLDILDSSLMPSASAAHAFELKSDVDQRFYGVGAEMVVTYHFTLSGTTAVMNSVMLPMSDSGLPWRAPTSAIGKHRLTATLHVQEPATIAMKQSGVVLVTTPWQSGAGSLTMGAPSQTARSMIGSATQVGDGYMYMVHQCEHSSSDWTLARGENQLDFDVYVASENARLLSAYAIVNYESGVAADGPGAHNQSTYWFSLANQGTPDNSLIWTPVEPVIPGSNYQLSGVNFYFGQRTAGNSACQLMVERLGTEDNGAGWYIQNTGPHSSAVAGEVGEWPRFFDLTSMFKPNTYATSDSGADIEAERDFWLSSVSNIDMQCYLVMTHHEIPFTYSGTLTVDGAAVGAATVYLYEHNTGETQARLIGEATTDGSGNYSFTVLDSTKNYVPYYDGSGHAGAGEPAAPGSGRDITYFTSGSAEKFHGSSFNRGMN